MYPCRSWLWQGYFYVAIVTFLSLLSVPLLIAIIAPVLTGLVLGVSGVLGLLIGGLSSGFVLAIFMANAGGVWDNAKKYVEEGNLGG